MSNSPMDRIRLGFRARQVLDVLVYSIAVTGLVFLLGVAITLVIGWGWVGIEVVMFLVGFAGLGYGVFRLRGPARWDVEFGDEGYEVKRPDESDVVGSRDETKFQVAVQRLPPLNWYGLAPRSRLPPAAKLFIASLFILLGSIIVEIVFIW